MDWVIHGATFALFCWTVLLCRYAKADLAKASEERLEAVTAYNRAQSLLVEANNVVGKQQTLERELLRAAGQLEFNLTGGYMND